MKRILLLSVVFVFGLTLFAEDSFEVPRYKGFAAGGDILSQFALGNYSNYAFANLGLSLTAEYTFPLELSHDLDLGTSLRAEYGHVFSKAESALKSDEEVRTFCALWLRVPFSLGNQYFAFQPEVGGGLSTFFTKFKTSDGNEKSGIYLSPLISITPSLRWIPKTVQKLEVETAPVFTIVPEKNNVTMMLGARLGAIWHFRTRHSEIITQEEVEEEAVMEFEPEAEKETLPEPEPVDEEVDTIPDPELVETEPDVIFVAEPEPVEEEPDEKLLPEHESESDDELEEEIITEPEPVDEPEEEIVTEPEATPEEIIPEPEPEVEDEPEEELVKEVLFVSERLELKNILFFSKNGAVFSGLSSKQIKQNERTIDEAVSIIKKYPDCKVVIEGYANNISGTEKEDRTACMPLSLWRAEYIKKELVKRGINAEQIEAVGKGGANPLASRTDRDNWWKNRRVEFVITYQSEDQNNE